MHNKKHPAMAIIAIVTGVVIIMSLVLPSQFWWFILAICLISLGIWLLRCR